MRHWQCGPWKCCFAVRTCLTARMCAASGCPTVEEILRGILGCFWQGAHGSASGAYVDGAHNDDGIRLFWIPWQRTAAPEGSVERLQQARAHTALHAGRNFTPSGGYAGAFLPSTVKQISEEAFYRFSCSVVLCRRQFLLIPGVLLRGEEAPQEFVLNFYEYSFCMALLCFCRRKADYCIIETGLLGRLMPRIMWTISS